MAVRNKLSKQEKAQRKFLRYFKKGFRDQKYYDWERWYKEEANERWAESLNKKEFSALLSSKKYSEIAQRAIHIESKTNLLFSFEKMAIRDAVKQSSGAKIFAEGLFQLLHSKSDLKTRFEDWTAALQQLPRIQTRVVTWPVATVFGFIGNPNEFIFLKPRVTQIAAEVYDFPFQYSSKVKWEVYESMLAFAERIRSDIKGWAPKDMIDLQSFIWVLGSDEYP